MAEHAGVGLVPLTCGELAAPEELMQGLGVHVEGREVGGVPGDGPQHILGHVLGCSPVGLEPVL